MESHLLQMRGLKRSTRPSLGHLGLSHLLQMRGLKQRGVRSVDKKQKSHLLQMRGLKQIYQSQINGDFGRIFYRCVD